MDELKKIINQIETQILNEGLSRYENGERQAKRDREFFEIVKVETKPLFELIDHWEELVKNHVASLKIMPNQIQNTKENLELFVFHSYYRDVRRKRFMEVYHSIDFVLKQLKQHL